MAIQAHTAELMMLCRQRFPKALDFVMIGRQWLRLRVEETQRLSKDHGVDINDLADPAGTDSVYAEPLLQRIGLQSIRALDASAYEGAELVQDLNQPLNPQLHECCDWLLDGGSLEHVFDFPTAIRNCTAMLRSGGLFVTACPVNNWMGHGFYQFSPELFFRVFSTVHGFEVRFAALHVRQGQTDRFWSIQDPAVTGRRLQYNPVGRMTLLFVAQKTATMSAPLIVQQSDYSTRWKDAAGASSDGPKTEVKGLAHHLKSLARRYLPDALSNAVRDQRVRNKKAREDQSGMRECANLAEAWKHWNP